MEIKEKRFSIEEIFNLVEIQHHAISISFIPDSKSFLKYKDGITLTQITNFTLDEILYRMQHKFFTYGKVFGKGYNNSPPISINIISISFDTQDIYVIQYL